MKKKNNQRMIKKIIHWRKKKKINFQMIVFSQIIFIIFNDESSFSITDNNFKGTRCKKDLKFVSGIFMNLLLKNILKPRIILVLRSLRILA